jgi:crotonobetainyl-CoA:carnitine CoA-transferase CaiB-like acyl-CoA transferase
MQPLQGTRVLEFGSGVPVALATLILAEAGAEVIKVEEPATGNAVRRGEPRLGGTALDFALLNRGKRSVTADLASGQAAARLRPLIETADVLVEGFRPGTMDGWGLGYDELRALNERLIYCSLTGWGQDGPAAMDSGEDLNFLGATGLLRLVAGETGAPVLAPGRIAFLAGGAMPAALNILLALRAREQGGGCRLDLAVCDALFGLAYSAIGAAEVTGRWPVPGGELLTGGSPRCRLYATADGRYVAVAAIDDSTWENLCERLDLDEELRDDRHDPEATGRALAAAIRAHDAKYWHDKFENRNLCASVVAELEGAVAEPQFRDRGLFRHRARSADQTVTAAVVPVSESFRPDEAVRDAPALGADDRLLEGS